MRRSELMLRSELMKRRRLMILMRAKRRRI